MKTYLRAGLASAVLVAASGLALVGCDAKKAEGPAPSAGVAVEQADAKAWLVALYAHYADGSNVTFTPLGAQAPNYFDQDMLDLMKADEAATPADEVGALDGDPICDCQDFGSLKADITTQLTAPGKVSATVILNETSPDFLTGEPPATPAPRTLTYELVKTPAGWRIHDIGYSGGLTLRGIFQGVG